MTNRAVRSGLMNPIKFIDCAVVFLALLATSVDCRPQTATSAKASVAKPTQTTWWAFRTPVKSTVSQIRNPQSEIPNPIDAFLLAKLRANGLDFPRPAGRRTL